MIKYEKSFMSKMLVLGLSFILFLGDFNLHSRGVPAAGGDLQNTFDTALAGYRNQSYQKSAARLETILSSIKAAAPDFEAKVYLLLGACYEQLGKKKKAEHYFLELKKLVDGRFIEAIPKINGVDTNSFPVYEEVFGKDSFFEFKEPVKVSEVLKHKVVHAPRKSIAQKQKEKRKKKFPWLIAVGAVVIIGTAVVLALAKEPRKERNINIEWIYIPAGEFLMGDNFNEGEADELPVHKVYLDEYYISKVEIKWEQQFELFYAATGKHIPPGTSGVVNSVSWIEAESFCDWLSRETGENIHLPTEAQWEKAARGTGQTRYPWGNEPAQSSLDNASPYGVLNMATYYSEWCSDWYSASYYSVSPDKNPTGPASGSYRVVRGGTSGDDDYDKRSAKRSYYDPAGDSGWLGFRIVKEASKK